MFDAACQSVQNVIHSHYRNILHLRDLLVSGLLFLYPLFDRKNTLALVNDSYVHEVQKCLKDDTKFWNNLSLHQNEQIAVTTTPKTSDRNNSEPKRTQIIIFKEITHYLANIFIFIQVSVVNFVFQANT